LFVWGAIFGVCVGASWLGGVSRFVETMLTVIETCRQQNKNAFDFVAEAVQASFARQNTPSLLPRV